MDTTPIDLSLRFDLRVPPFAATTYAAQHGACLDMAQWAEEHGFARVNLAEHHGDEAGFCSAPLTVAAAILGRTKRIHVRVSAALVPLHDPVRLAEQIATIDCLAPGRFSVVVGAGYRKAEFAMAGVDRGLRGRLVEECLAVWKKAWTGEEFQWRGRTIRVTPVPATPGGPLVLVGGKSEAAARRAGRLRYPFLPANANPALSAAYHEECRKGGYDGDVVGLDLLTGQPGFVMVSDDPEATWRQIGQNALYDAATYKSWQDDAVRSSFVVAESGSLEGLRASGQYAVLTPGDCAAMARKNRVLALHPLMGGIPPDTAWQGLHLCARDVLPHI
jgi:alkanesulfonate monooxygenase SsuD/methylene tetrahydromethanopterin reductase-like flavin-dependent oxidoreductase (luciferase family)